MQSTNKYLSYHDQYMQACTISASWMLAPTVHVSVVRINPGIDVEDFGRKMLKTIPTTKFYTGKKNLKIEN